MIINVVGVGKTLTRFCDLKEVSMARTDSRGVSLRGFRLSRQACDRYQFPSSLLSAQGNVALHNFHAARVFAQRMNTQRDLVRHPERAAKAGHINAMSLIDEINRQVSAEYRRQMNPEMLAQALRWLEERLGSEVLEETLVSLADVFPPRSVYQGTQTPTEFVAGESDETVHRQLLLEELLMVWLDNMIRRTSRIWSCLTTARWWKTLPTRPSLRYSVNFATRSQRMVRGSSRWLPCCAAQR